MSCWISIIHYYTYLDFFTLTKASNRIENKCLLRIMLNTTISYFTSFIDLSGLAASLPLHSQNYCIAVVHN